MSKQENMLDPDPGFFFLKDRSGLNQPRSATPCLYYICLRFKAFHHGTYIRWYIEKVAQAGRETIYFVNIFELATAVNMKKMP